MDHFYYGKYDFYGLYLVYSINVTPDFDSTYFYCRIGLGYVYFCALPDQDEDQYNKGSNENAETARRGFFKEILKENCDFHG
jgi:hypothetical protein